MYRSFFALFLLVVLTSCRPGPTPGDRPNIVVLFTDDQRFNTIQALGNAAISTPNLDRLATMGVAFNRAHIMGGNSGAVCAPSRAMLLSGRPWPHLPLGFTEPWSVSEGRGESPFITFPELFRKNGYTTFFTGKWHNDPPKLHAGFTTGDDIFLGGMHHLKDGGHQSPPLHHFDPSGRYPADQRFATDGFSSQLYADAAIRFLDTIGQDDPFLMYVAFTSPHDPRMAPPPFRDLYDADALELPPNFLPEHPIDNGDLRVRDELLLPFPRTPEDVRGEIAAYYAMISEVDAQIGRILDALESRNMTDNTVIVFAGDNGLAVGQHGLLGKQNLYDHSVRVPLIIAAPAIRGGRQAGTLCYLYDIFPTLCQLTGLPAPESVEGRSLLPALKDKETTIRDDLFLAYRHTQRALRTGDDWKLIVTQFKGENHYQLFNLNEDPWETSDLSGDPAARDRLQQLSNRLGAYLLEYQDDFLRPSMAVSYQDFEQPPQVSITRPLPTASLRYTLDGSTPNLRSTEYTGPLALTTDGEIRATAFIGGKAVDPATSKSVRMVDQFADITLTNPPADTYRGNGVFTLVDGQHGAPSRVNSGEWLGFRGDDFEAVIEFREAASLTKVGASFLRHFGAWIFAPRRVEISVSMDGRTFRPIAAWENAPANKKQSANERLTYKKQLDQAVNARFLKVKASNAGIIPDWHPGAGSPAWLFVDEITLGNRKM